MRTKGGKALADPVVVIEKDGKPYAWALGRAGRYAARLPAGQYTLYATGKNYSRSPALPVTVAPGSAQTQDFAGLAGTRPSRLCDR